MSPVAADCASAESAPAEPVPADVDAEVVFVVEAPVEAPLVEVDDELLDEDPQLVATIADASTTKTESLVMSRRLAI